MNNIKNKCILRDNNGIITSDYGFTYVMLSDLLHSGNYHNYIKDGDWIELTLANGDYFKLYANIDTYYDEGPDDAHKIGHHIDFISKDLIPGSAGHNGLYNSEEKSWRMRDDTLHPFGTNNGSKSEESPFLASSKKYKKDGNLIDKLDDYYTKLPDGLKFFIVKKYHKVPIRRKLFFNSRSRRLTKDTGTKWEDMGYLWLPYEKEVHGSNTHANSTYESHMKQYHSFANITDFKLKSDVKYDANSHRDWWVASAHSGSQYGFCSVSTCGGASHNYTYNWYLGAPLCFRFQ